MTMKTFRKRVHEVVLQGVKTTDAARPTRDAMLTIPTPEEWKAYNASVAKGVDLGQVWDGMESALEALDDDKRKAICDRFDAYRELKAGRKNRKAAGALDGTQDFDPFGRRESAKLGQEINDRNRAAWGKPAIR
jgi:hypothetical protein